MSGSLVRQAPASGVVARGPMALTRMPCGAQAAASPWVMAASAVLSLMTALWMSRLLARYSPAVILPILFASSVGGLVIEWAIGQVSPPAMAVAVFLHTAIFSPLLVSAFWSLIN